ncbi:MAG: hypothetical protein QM692_05540 [Thermomicrobiales bacterium]
MTGDETIIDLAPIQDRDLLQRLSIYFDAVDQRLRHGEGWMIFNAGARRSRRISGFIQHRLAEQRPPVAYFLLPWRDFAISSYVTEVGLPILAPEVAQSPRAEAEFNLAAKVTSATWTRMLSTDLLVLVGCKPAHRHEIELLDRTLENRQRQKLATILMTPEMPQQLEADLHSADPERGYWQSIFGRMYETGLVAM